MTGGRRRPWLPLVMMLLGFAVLIAACRQEAMTSVPRAPGLVKRFGSSPLTLELRLDRTRLTMAERLTVELRAETDEGYGVKFDPAAKFAGFALANATESQPEMTSPGRVAVTKHYLLDPLTPGEATLPAMAVEAWNKSEARAAITTVKTEPLSVRVETLLAKDDPGKTISDIAPPLAKPVNPWLWAGGAAAGILILGLGLFFWKRRRDRPPLPPPPLPPHLVAYQALERLLAADLLARGEVKTFYETLSAILRHYIEQRFGLRAPERTTEEFLSELGGAAPSPVRPGASYRDPAPAPTVTITAGHKRLVRDFLNHCDLVKFARHTPTRAEVEESVGHCRRFIRETEPSLPPEGQGGGAA